MPSVMAIESDADADESYSIDDDDGDGQLAEVVMVHWQPAKTGECADIADEMRTFLPQ